MPSSIESTPLTSDVRTAMRSLLALSGWHKSVLGSAVPVQ